MKSQSISTHKAWVEAGKPRNGSIFNDKIKAKKAYKNRIKKKKKHSIDNISDRLLSSLDGKDQKSFWKIWKAKFAKKNKNNNFNVGNDDEDLLTANKFADYYDNSCKNAVKNHSLGDKDLLFKKLRSYSGGSNLYESVDVNLIQNLIDKLSDGKSAGHDQLLAEHLKYSQCGCYSIYTCFISDFNRV